MARKAKAQAAEQNSRGSESVMNGPSSRAWSFDTKSRCPRCGSINTERVSTDGAVQYRRCRAPICRMGYKVAGRLV